MKRFVGLLAASAIAAAIVIAACSGGTRSVMGEPIPPATANLQPDVIPTVPPGVVTEFPITTPNGFPAYITSAGGNLWFTENSANQIGRVTTAGVVTEFTAGAATGPFDIITGPDGRPWFGAQTAQALGRVNTNGSITVVPIPTVSAHPEQLVADKPNNSIWFAERVGRKVGVYNLTTQTLTEYPISPGLNGPAVLAGIALDAAGNVWASDSLNDQVDELSTTGTVLQRLTLPGSTGPFSVNPWYMTLGKDGDLWVDELNGGPSSKGAIARIDPTTLTITTYVPRGPNPSAVGVATGPKGIWLPPEGGSQLVRITATGRLKEWVIPGAGGYGIVEGSDHNMWFVDYVNNAIAQVKVGLLP
jgi:virginiamycin B lyase